MILEFKLMGLEIGGSFARTFFRDFSRTYIFGPTSILVFLFLICVLLTLLVLCEREPASANAERFLCVHELVSKLERPPGYTTSVCLRHIRSTLASL